MNRHSKIDLSTNTTLLLSLFSLIFLNSMPVQASNFTDDASITGNAFSWFRDRERKVSPAEGYKPNLRHATFGTSINVKSGYIYDRLAIELGVYGRWNAINQGYYHPNEVSFSYANTLWDEKTKVM